MPEVQLPGVPHFDTVPASAPQARIDTSMYANALQQPAPPNLIGMIAQAAQAQNAMNQNKLFQLELVAKQRVGEIMKKHINPDTGEVDFHAAGIDLSTDPSAAVLAPQILNSWAQMENINAERFKKELDTRIEQDNYLQTQLGGLTALGNGVTKKDAKDALLNSFTKGIVKDPNQALTYMMKIEELGDGAPLARYIKQVQLASMPSAEAAKAVSNQLETMDLGKAGRYITERNPYLGTFRQLGHVPAERQITESEATPDLPVGTTIQPPPEGPLFEPSAAPAGAAPPSAKPGPLVTKQAPSEEQFQSEQGKVQSDYERNLNIAADASRATLQETERLKRVLEHLRPGGGAGFYRTLGDVADALGVRRELVDELSLGSRAGTYEFDKGVSRLVQYAIRPIFAGAGGIRIAGEFNTLKEAFPVKDMPKEAILDILNFMEFQSREDQLERQFYDKYVIQGQPTANGKKLTRRQWPAFWASMLKASGGDRPPPPMELLEMVEKKKTEE